MQEFDLIEQLSNRYKFCTGHYPNKSAAAGFIDGLFEFLFVPRGLMQSQPDNLHEQFNQLKQALLELVGSVIPNQQERVQQDTDQFMSHLPRLYHQLMEDANEILRFDPAAGSLEEVLVAYPGFYATAVYRFSHHLHQLNLPVLPRVFSEHAHSKTGIDIHPGAQIGRSFFIDHGTGIVIGETAEIGDYVKIYQGVTLGALNVSKDQAARKRHPTIEDHVVIYSGATILGGETVVGHNSIIGGNVWLTESVLPYSIVYHKSQVVVKDQIPVTSAINFVI